MPPSQRRRAFVLLFILLAGCSTFSESDPDPQGADAGTGDAGDGDAGLSSDAPMPPSDAEPDAPPVGYVQSFHFDNDNDCALWAPRKDATFTGIPVGHTGRGCRLCGSPTSTDGTASFAQFQLTAAVGTYSITGYARREAATPTLPSKFILSLRETSMASPDAAVDEATVTPSFSGNSSDGTWVSATKGFAIKSALAPDQSLALLFATIELDPDNGGSATDQCYEVDDISVTFTP